MAYFLLLFFRSVYASLFLLHMLQWRKKLEFDFVSHYENEGKLLRIIWKFFTIWLLGGLDVGKENFYFVGWDGKFHWEREIVRNKLDRSCYLR